MPRRKLVELELSVETIEPEVALEWLEHNVKNRKVSQSLVEVYAEVIRDG